MLNTYRLSTEGLLIRFWVHGKAIVSNFGKKLRIFCEMIEKNFNKTSKHNKVCYNLTY